MKEMKRKQISEERKKQYDAIWERVEHRSDDNWKQQTATRKRADSQKPKNPEPNMIVPFAKEESPSRGVKKLEEQEKTPEKESLTHVPAKQ